MIFVSLLIDSPDPIELIVVDSNPDVVENDLEAININDFFRLSGQIISASGGEDRMPKMNESSFNVTKNLGIITGTLLPLKFIYSEKATKFCEVFPLLLSVCNVDKTKVEIPQNFVALSEYTNFTVQIWVCSAKLLEFEGLKVKDLRSKPEIYI